MFCAEKSLTALLGVCVCWLEILDPILVMALFEDSVLTCHTFADEPLMATLFSKDMAARLTSMKVAKIKSVHKQADISVEMEYLPCHYPPFRRIFWNSLI